MALYGYFLLGLVLFAFFGSKWVRPILQCVLHSTVYFLVSLSSKLQQQAKLGFRSIKRRLVSTNIAGARIYDELAAEKEAIETWNMSLASEAVDFVIVPVSLLIQLLIIGGVLTYVQNSSSDANDSGPWGLLGTNSLFDLTVIVTIVNALCVACVIYIGYLIIEASHATFLNWPHLLQNLSIPLPSSFFRCIGTGISRAKSMKPGVKSNSNNHPALTRLHDTQLHQDLQQENFTSFVDTVINFIGGTVVILMVLTSLSVDLTPVLGIAGIGAAAVGYASTDAIQSLIGAACIFISGQLRVGDIVTLNGTQVSAMGIPQPIQGVVKAVTPLYTYVYGYDSNFTIIPNSWFVTNIGRVWRSSDQMCQSFLFIFGRTIKQDGIKAFKAKFRELLNQYEELNPDDSYVWLNYADYSSVRYQAVVYASSKNAYAKAPQFLFNLSVASSSRADCDPSLEAQRCAEQNNIQFKTTSAGAMGETEDMDEKAERLKEQQETEMPGNRPFFNAAHAFYIELHTWCLESGYPQVETMLYT